MSIWGQFDFLNLKNNLFDHPLTNVLSLNHSEPEDLIIIGNVCIGHDPVLFPVCFLL